MTEGYFKHCFNKNVHYAQLMKNMSTGELEVAHYPINQDTHWNILSLEKFSRAIECRAGNPILYYFPCDEQGNELPISEWPDNELYRAFKQETNYDKDSINKNDGNERTMSVYLGNFKHYKNLNKDGAMYYAKIGQYTESKMLFAIYWDVRNATKIWVSPLDMFMGYVQDSDGNYVRRFVPCDADGKLLN